MQVEVSKTEKYYQIRFPIKERYTNQQVGKFMDYLKIKNTAEKSSATDAVIKNLSEEIMENWWEKNRKNFVKV